MLRTHAIIGQSLALMAAVTIGITAPSPAKGQPAPCVVRDTSGTPLNIRATPNGRVFATVRNGVRVSVLDYDYDRRGRQWALILFTDRGVETRGWVIRRYVAC
jgi:hypothetical protein